MEKIDGQEVALLLLCPELPKNQEDMKVGSELLRFVDRNNNKMLLGMTHEKVA